MSQYGLKMNERSQRKFLNTMYNMITEDMKIGVDVPTPGYGCSTRDSLCARDVDSPLVLLLYLKNGTKKIGALVGFTNDAEALSAVYQTAQNAKDIKVEFYTQRGILFSKEEPAVSGAICDIVKQSFPEMQIEVRDYDGKFGDVRLDPEAGEWQTENLGKHSFVKK